jgi:hypothetical protein
LEKAVRQRDTLSVALRKAAIDVQAARDVVKTLRETVQGHRDTIADLRDTIRELVKERRPSDEDGPSLAMVRAGMFMDQMKDDEKEAEGIRPLGAMVHRIGEVHGGEWQPPEVKGHPGDIFGEVIEQESESNDGKP